MTITIRQPRASEFNSWQPLWQQYLEFYQSGDLDSRLTDLLWQRIHDEQHEFACFVAENEQGDLVGLVHFFPHSNTWYKQPVCYLEDLFVAPVVRGLGVGEQLINAVIKTSEDNSWASVYWHTQCHNEVARGLYDKVTGGNDGFVKYSMAVMPKSDEADALANILECDDHDE